MCFPSSTRWIFHLFLAAPLKWGLKPQTLISRAPPEPPPAPGAHPGVQSQVWVAAEVQWLPHLFKQLLHGWFWIYKHLGSFEIPRLEMLVSLPASAWAKVFFTLIQVGEKVPAVVLLLCWFFTWEMKNPFRHWAFHALLHPLEPFLPDFRHIRKNPDVSGIKKKREKKPPNPQLYMHLDLSFYKNSQATTTRFHR